MSPIKLNVPTENLKNPYQQGTNFVQLPFPVLHLNWHNGNAQADKSSGPRHFGGWQSGSETAREDMALLNLATMPALFREDEWFDDKGKTYMAFGSRGIYAAPILCKSDWWMEYDAGRSKNVKRHRLDYLVYIGTVNENKTVVPYAPGVLTSSGFAASGIEAAFKRFAKEIKPACDQYAPGVPTAFFYVPVGTFGDKRISSPAGDSVYVPAQFKHYDEWTEELLTSIFVGEEVALQIMDLQAKAAEWANDTHENRVKNFTEEPGGMRKGIDNDPANDPTLGMDELPPGF